MNQSELVNVSNAAIEISWSPSAPGRSTRSSRNATRAVGVGESAIWRSASVLLMLSLAIGVTGLMVAFRKIAGPMDRISKAMLQVADGNLAEDVPYRGRRDEIGRLAERAGGVQGRHDRQTGSWKARSARISNGQSSGSRSVETGDRLVR